MAQLIVAAAGAAIGGMIAPGVVAFGMTGAAMGWMAGSVIGSMFAPTQKSEGPRLGDLSVSGSSYGTPIPWVAGSPRVSGQVVWASAKREIATTQSAGGKGGGGSEYTSYTYEIDLMILLTDNPIETVSRIWSNGDLIYTARADTDSASRAASSGSGKWARLTVYKGDATQLPDPTYEAAVGTANAPAYRGRGSVFIQSLQLGSGGQVPNLTFELNQSIARDTAREIGVLSSFDTQINADEIASDIGPNFVSVGMSYTPGQAPPNAVAENIVLNWPVGGGWRLEGYFYLNGPGHLFSIGDPPGQYLSMSIGGAQWSLGYITRTTPRGSGGGGWGDKSNEPAYTGELVHWAVQQNSLGIVTFFLKGQLLYSVDAGFTSGAFTKLVLPGVGPSTLVQWRSFDMPGVAPLGQYTDTAYPGPYVPWGLEENGPLNTVTETVLPKTLPTVVSNLMLMAGYTADQFDVSALPTAKVVRALANSSVSTARTVIDMLSSTYFFDEVCTDKIYFVPRGGAPVATISWDELGVTADSTNPPDPLPLTIADELEIPAQMALTYNNVDGDYQTDTQYSDRLLTGQESTSTVQVPMGFTAAEAKAIVDAMLLDKAVAALSTSISVDITRAALQPTDVLMVIGEDGSSYRMRTTTRNDAGGVTTLTLVGDDASVLVQPGITSGGTASQTTVLPVATTTLALLDVPLLRDADDKPGLYVAVAGNAANWAGCAIYESLDDVTYTQVTTLADQTAIGSCSTTLGDWTGGNVFDESNTVTVNVGAIQQLASVSRDDALANPALNAALIGSELVQYMRATLVSAGVYTLSGLLRGRRGTEWASVGHVAAERFVALGASGLRFLTLQSSDLGRIRYYKGVSAGQKLSDVTAQTITPAGVALECLSPVNARANRATTDTVLTWTRRTRLSTRLTGSLPINAPLGEVADAYDVEVWDSAYTTLKRTLSASSPTATYTAAQQVADFGANQATLYLKIYQLSATVARGYPLKVSV
jgi:hypothetical protein